MLLIVIKVDLLPLRACNFSFSRVFSLSRWQEHTTELQCNIASESGLGNIYLFTVLGKVTFAQAHIYFDICMYMCVYIYHLYTVIYRSEYKQGIVKVFCAG